MEETAREVARIIAGLAHKIGNEEFVSEESREEYLLTLKKSLNLEKDDSSVASVSNSSNANAMDIEEVKFVPSSGGYNSGFFRVKVRNHSGQTVDGIDISYRILDNNGDLLSSTNMGGDNLALEDGQGTWIDAWFSDNDFYKLSDIAEIRLTDYFLFNHDEKTKVIITPYVAEASLGDEHTYVLSEIVSEE